MKRYLFFFFTFCFSFCSSVQATDPGESAYSNIDREQQQLKWCFIYSNMLGFNISYINNPRLYKLTGEWLGTPYKYSGFNKNGVDCSGLVSCVMSNSYSKEVNGTAKDLFHKSRPLSRNELKEGDLVFFKIKKNRISHVGIYLGENKFVHASLKKGVIISDLYDPYYEKYFFKGGRIIY